MTSRLYVGNLSFSTTVEGLRAAFATDGRTVVDAAIINDRETGRSRGFGFVEMGSPREAEAAIEAMDGAELDGRTVRVSAAREREPRGSGPPRAREPSERRGPRAPRPSAMPPAPDDAMGATLVDRGPRRRFDDSGHRGRRRSKRRNRRPWDDD